MPPSPLGKAILSRFRRERIPGVPVASQEEALSTGKARTPTLPTLGGVLTNVNLNNSFVETSDINDINYISEGFLSRYYFSLKAKSTGFFGKLLKSLAVIVVLAAAAVATVFTCGAAGVVIGGTLVSLSAGALGTIGLVSGIAASVAVTAVSA